MTDAVPRLNLAPKLNRPLQLWNPIDYLRLLYWIFYFPQALLWYEENFLTPKQGETPGKDLRKTITQGTVVPQFGLTALILCLFIVLAFALEMETAGLLIDWSKAAIGASIGVFIGMAGAFFVPRFSGAILGESPRMVENIAAGIVGGIAAGMVGVMVFTGMVEGVDSDWFFRASVIFGAGVSGGLLFRISGGMARGVALNVAGRVSLFWSFIMLEYVLVFAVPIRSNADIGMAVYMVLDMTAIGMALTLMVLRIDACIIAAILSLFSHPASMTNCTPLPLPGLKRNLKYWLRCDWSNGTHNINELLSYSMQFIPAIQALNESLAEHPPEGLFLQVDEVSMHPYDWNMLRYCSAPLSNGLKIGAIDGIVFFPRSWKQRLKARYPIDPRLDSPARAVCAGFWHLHEKQPLLAAQAFAVVQKLPHGEEMYRLSQAFHLAQSVKDFQSLATLAGQAAFLQATTQLSGHELLHPQTWQALDHLRRCALEAHAMWESASKAARSWALNRAIGEVVAVQKMIGTLPEAERALVEEIAKSWQSILVSHSAEVGSISISEPVKNPYVAGDPVVGSGFKGREDTIRELKQLWSGTTKPPSVVLYGHRRMGKTSILRNINSHLGSEVRLAYVNLLILGGAERGLSDLFLAIADEIRASLPELPEAEMDEFDRHPELAFKQYLDLAQSALGKSRLIIALDEFEKLEEWMNAGRIPSNLLDTFRGYIQKDQNIAFAFAGLHKLEEMTEDYFNPLFASVRPIRVSFLSKEAAFQVLANPPLEDFPLDFQPEALERIWELTGGQPYLVQLVGHYLVSRFNRLTFELGKPMEPVFNLEDVDAVIEDPEFYSQGRYYFAGIWGQAGQGAEGQQEVMKLLASSLDGISFGGIISHSGPDSKEIYAAALKELQRHDVLREKDGVWQFTVELMRRWVKDFMQNSDN